MALGLGLALRAGTLGEGTRLALGTILKEKRHPKPLTLNPKPQTLNLFGKPQKPELNPRIPKTLCLLGTVWASKVFLAK